MSDFDIYLAYLTATFGEDATKTTIDLGVSGASVGQFLTVGSVDSSGKPTSWTAITVPDANNISY